MVRSVRPRCGAKVAAELAVIVVVEAFDGRFLDRAVPLPGNGLLANRERDPFDLAVGPGVLDLGQAVLDLGQAVLDLMLAADPVKDVFKGINMPIVIGKLDAIIGEHDVEPVGHGGDQVAQKGSGGHFPGLLVQFHESKLGGAVDGNEEIQLACSRLNLSNINVNVAQRVGQFRSCPTAWCSWP